MATATTERFTGRVEAYERYRMRYPAEVVLPRLRSWCGLTAEWRIADIGAGTGMLSEVFLENGNAVVAVEPNDEMRAGAERLRAQWPALEIVNAAAEATTLPDASVEMIAAGRAFHWFDRGRALPEFRRILKPGGWLALVALGRAHGDDAAGKAFEQVLHEFGTDPDYRRRLRTHEDMEGVFAGDMRQEEIVIDEQRLGWETLLGNTMSFSMAPMRDNPRFAAFEHGLRAWFERWQEGGEVSQHTACWVTVGRL